MTGYCDGVCWAAVPVSTREASAWNSELGSVSFAGVGGVVS